MNYEDKDIQERFGKDNPFRVPAGYFDQLTERVMSQLPEREQQAEQISLTERRPKSRRVALRPWLYAAACVVVLVVMSVVWLFHQQPVTPQVAVASPVSGATTSDSSYMDEAADYVMLDNAEIYACLSDNY